ERALRWARRRPAAAALVVVSGLAVCALLATGGWYSARLQAALDEARAGRREADDARADAERSARASQQQLVRLTVGNGIRQQEDGDLAGALVWLADALGREEDPQKRDIHRLRLALFRAQCPRLVQLWFHDDAVVHAEHSPDGGRVLTVAGKQARVWDALTGQPGTPPPAHGSAVPHATLSPDGRPRAPPSAHPA